MSRTFTDERIQPNGELYEITELKDNSIDATPVVGSLHEKVKNIDTRVELLELSPFVQQYEQEAQPTSPNTGDKWYTPSTKLNREFYDNSWKINTNDTRLADGNESIIINGGTF